MTKGSIPRHLVVFSLPMLAGNVIQTAYSIINAAWVGKGLGKADFAAVTVSFPIVMVLIAVAIGLTLGTSIIVAQFAGAKEWDRLKKAVQTSIVLVACVSTLCLIVGEFTAAWIMRVMQTPHDVYALAVNYLRIFLIAIPLNFAIFLASSMMRGIGDSKTPLYFQIFSLIGTAILDPILMFGWLGMPRFGLNGTAYATIIMQLLCVIAVFTYLDRQDHVIAPDWRHLGIDWPTLKLICRIGLPAIVQHSLISIGMLFVIGIVNEFGESAIAAFGAAQRIDQIAFLPALTFGGAVSTIVGQNIGAGRLYRVKEIFRWGSILSGGITLSMAIFAVTTPYILMKMFLNDSSAMLMGVHYLRIMGAAYICFAIMFVGNGVLNGAGYTFITTIISLVSLWAARVPLAVYLSHRMHAVEGVFIAMAVSSGVSMIISLICYLSGIWKRPIIHHAPQPDAEMEEGVTSYEL